MITYKFDRKEVDKLLRKLHRKAGDLRPFFKVATVIITRSVMKNFRAQGRPNKWRPLSPLSVANRRAEGSYRGAAILQRYGDLRQSVGVDSSRPDILEISKTQMKFGTRLIKAPLLHFGGTVRAKGGKSLTIPLPGVTGRARDYENTFTLKKTGSGDSEYKGVMMQKQEDGTLRPLFLLRRSVTIKPRPFLLFQDEDIETLGEYLLAFLLDIKTYKGLSV